MEGDCPRMCRVISCVGDFVCVCLSDCVDGWVGLSVSVSLSIRALKGKQLELSYQTW